MTIVSFAIVGGVLHLVDHYHMGIPMDSRFVRLFAMFFYGGAFYVLKDRITLSQPIFWSLVAAVLVTLLATQKLFVAYMLILPYVLFYVAYVPSGFIRSYNQMGDYSYGVYIWAWPIQQSIAALVPGVSVLAMLLVSASGTIVLAALSWHLIEQRALRLKGRYAGYARSLFPGSL